MWYTKGSWDICGEYNKISGRYYLDSYCEPYTYAAYIVQDNGYQYGIDLCLNSALGKVSVLEGKTRLLKEAKQAVQAWLKEKHDHTEEIEQWKKLVIKPVFDSNLNLIGDWYAHFPIYKYGQDKETQLKKWAYFNPNYAEAPAYLLDRFVDGGYQLTHFDGDVRTNSLKITTEESKELLKKALSQLNHEKYSKFFEVKDETENDK